MRSSQPAGFPLDAAARLGGCRGRVLLHSGRDDDGLGRWSFAAAEPITTLIARGHSIVMLDHLGRPVKRFTGDPFEALGDDAKGCTGLERISKTTPLDGAQTMLKESRSTCARETRETNFSR